MKRLILLVLVFVCGLFLALAQAVAGCPKCATVQATSVRNGWEYPVPGWAYYYREGRLTWAYSLRTHRYYPARARGWGVARVSASCDCEACPEECDCGCQPGPNRR